MTMTIHALQRCQQRGISPFVIDLLFRFGCYEHDNSGAEVIYFDKRAKRNIERYTGGALGKLSEHMNSYAVVADGRVVTVGSRYKKINRQ